MHDAAKKRYEVVKQIFTSQNKNKWSTSDCSFTRKRGRLFFFIYGNLLDVLPKVECFSVNWKPESHTERHAVQNVINNKYKILSKLYTKKCPRKFWNAIRKLKQTKSENHSCADGAHICV